MLPRIMVVLSLSLYKYIFLVSHALNPLEKNA